MKTSSVILRPKPKTELYVSVFLVLTCTLVSAEETAPKKSYAGFRIIETKPTNENQQWFIRELSHNGHVRLLSPGGAVRHSRSAQGKQHAKVVALVPPERWSTTRRMMTQNGINFDVLVDDFQKYIDDSLSQRTRAHSSRKRKRLKFRHVKRDVREARTESLQDRFPLDKYHSSSDVDKFLDLVIKTSPFAEIITFGKSSQGRNLKAVHVAEKYSKGTESSTSSHPKPVIFVDAGIHAREWITVSSALCIITHLVTYYSTDAFLQQFHWIILPVLNPDGYEYSWKNDRLWRKTRSKPIETSNVSLLRNSSDCMGVDPNRNWGNHWGERGVQRYNVCTEVYAGPYPFSEPEVAALSDLVEYYRERTALYVSLHAFSQVILSPYGFSSKKPIDYNRHVAVMKAGVDAIKSTSGYTYNYGSIYDAMYAASGSSIDYIYGSLGIKHAYVIELRDTGKFGFVLPQREIIPTCKETIAGILAMAREAYKSDRS